MDDKPAEKRALFGRVPVSESMPAEPTSVSKAIRRECLHCSGGSRKEVRYCSHTDCPTWPYRMGISPKTLAKRDPSLLDSDAVLRMRA